MLKSSIQSLHQNDQLFSKKLASEHKSDYSLTFLHTNTGTKIMQLSRTWYRGVGPDALAGLRGKPDAENLTALTPLLPELITKMHIVTKHIIPQH